MSRRNPTLYHHLHTPARYHIVGNGNEPLADLYTAAGTGQVKSIARAIANAYHQPVLVLDNRDRPGLLHQHALEAYAKPRRARRNPRELVCYGQTRGRGWVQEWYETSSGDARRRSGDLRRLGFRVHSESSVQVTPVGTVRMTLVDIRGSDDMLNELPPVRVERMNPARSAPARQRRIAKRRFFGSKRQMRAQVRVRQVRGTEAERSALARLRHYADSTSRRIQRAAWRNPSSPPLAVGDRVSVPYTGRSRRQQSERGTVVGINGGVHVEVKHGKRLERHAWPLEQVRRARRQPWTVTRTRRASTLERLDLKALRQRRKDAERAARAARNAYDCAEAKAKQAQPMSPDESATPEYRRARAQMTRALNLAEAHELVAHRAAMADPATVTGFEETASNPADGKRLFEEFHGRRAHGTRRVRLPYTRELVKLGELKRIGYQSDKGDGKRRLYVHDTKRPHPVLAAGTDGSFHILGGHMRVTDRGLEN